MRLVDVQSPMDIAALVWDKNTFYAALLDAPDAVRELADKVKRLLTTFLDLWFSRYDRSFMAHFPDYYMPHGLTLSEDEIGSVSPALFETLFLPELAELSVRYGGLGVHCCANARHQWDGVRSPQRFPEGAHIVLTSTVETLENAKRRVEAFHGLYG